MGANLKPHLFQPGNPGGPGRKLGSRNRLAEVALQAERTTCIVGGLAGRPRARSCSERLGNFLASVVQPANMNAAS